MAQRFHFAIASQTTAALFPFIMRVKKTNLTLLKDNRSAIGPLPHFLQVASSTRFLYVESIIDVMLTFFHQRMSLMKCMARMSVHFFCFCFVSLQIETNLKLFTWKSDADHWDRHNDAITRPNTETHTHAHKEMCESEEEDATIWQQRHVA